MIMKSKFFIFIFLAALLLLSSCNKQDETSNLEDVNFSETVETTLDMYENDIYEPIEIPYKLITIKNQKTIDSILKSLPDTVDKNIARKIIMTLNRKEFRFIKNNEQIIIPKIFTNNILDYSIFPQYYPAAKEIKKIIMVSIEKQAYGCYEYGKLVRFAAINSGKEKTPSFPGRYALVWKERLRRSSLDSTWIMPFTFNFHSEAGSAFHQFQMPGRPVSHSCLRQFMDDAEWLFHWGETAKRDANGKIIPYSGTPVILLGHFDFSRKVGGPWLDLTSNKDGIVELPDNPMEVEEALIPIIQIPKEARSYLRNKERYLYAEDTLRARGIIRPGVQLTPSINYNVLRRQKQAQKMKQLENQNINTNTYINTNNKVLPNINE